MIPLGDADVQRRMFPYVTVALILINAVVFVYEFSLSDLEQHIFILKNGLIPAELTSGQEFRYLGNRLGDSLDILSPFGTWATLLTSMFLHGGWLHIIFNMLFLWGFGGNVEDRVGHVKYLVFYLVAGLAASMAQVGIDMDSQIPMVGASGAIAGVLGAYLILHPFNRINVLIIFVFITAVRVPAVLVLGAWFILELFKGTVGTLGPETAGGGVAYFAHVGGFLAGFLMMAVYKLLVREPLIPRRPGRTIQYWRGRPLC